jgi:hypothetical protein
MKKIIKRTFLILIIGLFLCFSTSYICFEGYIINGKNIESKNIGNLETLCSVFGTIKGPFNCFRIPGTLYIIESYSGGELYIEKPNVTLVYRGDFLKIIIIGWAGMFIFPLHNGKNLMDREFNGYVLLIDFEIN